MKLKLFKKTQEVLGVYTFLFEPETPLTWQAGQFLRYSLDIPEPDDRGNNRYFTIASAPFEKHIQITTRILDQKGSKFKSTLLNLPEGSEIEAYGPSGNFTVENLNRSYVFVAGGIGITPFRSIISELDHQKKPLNITLLYSSRDQNIIFKELLDQINLSHPELKINYISDPERIDEASIKKYVSNYQDQIYYLSGPQPMVEAIEKLLLESLKIPSEQIKLDYFPGYSEI